MRWGVTISHSGRNESPSVVAAHSHLKKRLLPSNSLPSFTFTLPFISSAGLAYIHSINTFIVPTLPTLLTPHLTAFEMRVFEVLSVAFVAQSAAGAAVAHKHQNGMFSLYCQAFFWLFEVKYPGGREERERENENATNEQRTTNNEHRTMSNYDFHR